MLLKRLVRLLILLIGANFVCRCTSQSHVALVQNASLKFKVKQELDSAVLQYKLLMQSLPEDAFARTFEKGKVQIAKSDGWVSGFYPGTLLYLYQYFKDSLLLGEAERKLSVLQKEQFDKNTHDLGFMMYCSFGNASRITHKSSYQSVLINSARSLSTRFNPIVGCVRSWDSDSSHFLVIIDNMMNLELLMYAFHQTGDSSFYKIAVSHANTTMKNHFRSDYSSYHVIDYNPLTGAVQKKRTHQGAFDESAWARGQAWGLYGFTMMYRETSDKKYLNQAQHIASFILDHPNLPADKIPYWDFNAPGIPKAYRDASAAAVISSALLELANYVSTSDQRKYRQVAETILKNLSSRPYKTFGREAGGFLLNHSVGNLPGKSEMDVPLSYADYYYVEAALRYLGLLNSDLMKL